MSEAQNVAVDAQKSSEVMILNTLITIVPHRKCVEVRGQNLKGYWWSGFYDNEHLQKLAHDAKMMELNSKGIYVTLNTTNPDLLSRRLNRIETHGIKNGDMTSDNDITNWDYLPIDVDPKRASGISSTDEELKASFGVAMAVKSYLTANGFPEPIVACSGNGCHILYKIDLPRSKENDVVVKKFLYALSKKFNTESVGVDVSNSNPSRIFKLYGTWARKGENTVERPHRLSFIKSDPDTLSVVPLDKLNVVIYSEKQEVVGTKKSAKVKTPKEVAGRHPEFLKIVGKMVNGGFEKSAILAAIQDVNANFDDPKTQEVLLPEFENIYKYITERQTSTDNLPSYIFPIINEETGAIEGYGLDYAKYSTFLAHSFGTVYFNETIYLYDAQKHIYVSSVNEIETHIRNTTIEYCIKTPLTKIIQEVIKHLESMGGYREYPFNCDTTTLPVKNGILKFDFEKGTEELLPHGKQHLFTYTLDADYIPTAPTEPVLNVLRGWVAEQRDVIRLIQAPAQGLVQMQTRHSHKKAYMFQGETNSGKTSYFKLLIKLFSKDFVGAASLQSLCEDKFVGFELEGKILNIRDDLKAIPLKTCEQFKEITGDCSIRVEQKYKTGYRGWATAVMMFSCNYPPRCEKDVKKDSAFWDRLEYIKFPFSFEKNIMFYDTTYTPEFMSGFLNLLIEMVLRIHSTGALPVISEPGEVLMNWSSDADPLQNFMDDTFRPSEFQRDFCKTKLHALYKSWCRENGIDERRIIQGVKQFTSAMAPFFVVADHRLPKNKDGIREHIRVFRGNFAAIDAKVNLDPESSQQIINNLYMHDGKDQKTGTVDACIDGVAGNGKQETITK